MNETKKNKEWGVYLENKRCRTNKIKGEEK